MTQIQGYELSKNQAKIWRQDINPEKWLIRAAIAIEAESSEATLRETFTSILARHEALATVFPMLPGMVYPLQELKEEACVAWRSLTAIPSVNLERVWTDFRNALPSLNFAKGPIAEIHCHPLERGFLLLVVYPALALDLPSLGILVAELNQALNCGLETESEELVQSLDFSDWQQDAGLDLQSLQLGKSFWQKRNAGTACPTLPGFTKAADEGFSQVTDSLAMPFDKARVVAVWAMVLAKYLATEQVTVNVLLDPRYLADFKTTVGPLAVYVPIHLQLKPDTMVSKALEIATGALLECSKNLPFRFWDETEPLHPGFDLEVLPCAGASWRQPAHLLEIQSQSQPCHLKLTLFQRRDDWKVTLDFPSSAYSHADMCSLLTAFLTAYQTATLETQTQHLQLATYRTLVPLVTAGEGVSQPARWDHVLAAFQASVLRQPLATAVVAEGQTLSYQALDQWSNAIAAQLAALHVRPETPVGVFFEPCPALIASIWGIFKAGGAFVAMDPMYPQERLNHILQLSKASLVLTQDGLRHHLPAWVKPLLPAPLPSEPCAAPALSGIAHPDQMAYLLFTSGSTGIPKGVMVTHGNLINYLEEGQALYGGTRGALFHSSIGFDLTITSLFLPVLSGGRVVIPSKEGLEGIQESLLVIETIDILKLTPSHLKGLHTWLQDRQPHPHELVLIVGGESLTFEAVAAWLQAFPNSRVINEYGPTETTVGCSVHVYGKETLGHNTGSVPIGLPMRNVQLHLVGPDGQLVPQGMLGELWIAGRGVTRGYRQQPRTTAQRFVPNPFARKPGERCYRSGDLVRWAGDAQKTLIFHGRNDHQVKLRGFRIELAEIENALARFPGVLAAHVRVWDHQGVAQLVAYCHARDTLSAEDLQQALNKSLPFYMVPQRFFSLASWPLTPHGKLDSSQLPSPETDQHLLTEAFALPEPGLETTIAQVWQRSLGIQKVGRNDNYFTLGGDSIRSVHTVAQLQEAGLSLSMPDLFKAPTVKGLAALLADLASTHQADTAPNRPFQANENQTTPPFSLVSDTLIKKLPADAVDAYPLGAVQLGMLLHMNSSTNQDSPPAYHNVATYRFQMPFAVAVFQQAVDHVVQRHPNLRTAFDLDRYYEPIQIVYREAKLWVTFIDLTPLRSQQQDAEVKRFIATENFRLMAIDRPPLVRLTVHIHAPGEVSLSITEPHSISDGWSTHLTLKEIFLTYMALLRGQTPPFKNLGHAHYGDFIRLEREAIEAPQVRDFWQRRMEQWQPSPLPSLPKSFHPNPSLYDHKIYNYVPRSLLDALRAFADHAGVPFKSVCLAAHLKVLSVISGSTTVTTGLVFNGRPEAVGGEDIRGLFLNTLPFTFQFDSGDWVGLVQQVYQTEVDMYPFRRYPLGVLQAQNGNRKLFDVGFTFHHFHSVNEVIHEDWFKPIKSTDLSKTNFDYTAAFTINPLMDNNLTLMLEANLNVLSLDTFRSLYSYYEQVFQAIAAALEASARGEQVAHQRHHFLPTADYHQLVHTWNQTEREFEPWLSLAQRIETLASRQPEVEAIHFDGQCQNYRELVLSSMAIQGQLQALHLPPETPVAVLMERNLLLPASLLGILRAGFSFLPLDLHQPLARLDQIVKTANLKVAVVLSNTHGSQLASDLKLHRLEVDLAPLPDAPLPSTAVAPNQAAYTLFTSGSTGTPKGVTNTHAGLENLLQVAVERYGASPTQRMLQKTPITFDIFIWEMFQPLVAGGSLVLAKHGGEADQLYIAELMRAQSITMTLFVPSVLAVFLDAPGVENLPALKTIACIGEALPKGTIARFREKLPHVALINAYGPTEAAVSFTDWECVSQDPEYVSIGKPYPNCRTYIASSNLWPVPIGTAGDLYLGGIQLARGYLNQPALTALAFLPDPFAKTPGARIYRTGDAARWLPNGEIHFIGRLDSQVKLRGHRIELGEIETWLTRHPGVQASAVLIREDVPGNSYLCAYVMTQSVDLNAALLQTYLRSSLPAYMVPDVFVFLDSLPRSTSGKIHRQTLADLPAPNGSGATFVDETPLTAIGEQICAIWEHILGKQPHSGHANFFEMGGQSLLATRALYQIRDTFQVEMTIRDFFENAQLAQQAAWVERHLQTGQGIARPALVRNASLKRGPASFAQQRVWLAQEAMPESTAFNMSFAIQLKGDFQEEHLVSAIQALVARQEVLRTRFSFEAGQLYQIIEDRVPEVAVENLCHLSSDAQSILLEDMRRDFAQRPFDLQDANLFEARLLRTHDDTLLLMLRIHHVLTDAWSNAILFREIRTLYQDSFHHRSPSLAPLTVRYLDYALWQRTWLQDEGTAGGLAFWRRYLADAPLVQPLPLAPARRPEVGFAGDVFLFELNPSLTKDLLELGREQRASLFMLLMTGYQVMLHCFTGETDVVVGTDVANRSETQLQDLIGFFVNQMPLRLQCDPAATLQELLARQRTSVLSALAHQDTPFDQLVEALNPPRKEHLAPIFQRKLVLNNTPDAAPEAGTETQRMVPFHQTTSAKVDLQLNLRQRGNRILASFNYKTGLFSGSDVEALANAFILVLETMTANPASQLLDLHARVQDLEARRQQNLVEARQQRARTVFGTTQPRQRKF